MPQIAAPTFTGERYIHTAGAPFASPTLVVFLDAGIGSTPDVIKDVRQGVALASRQMDIIWAFLNHRPEDIGSPMAVRGMNRPSPEARIIRSTV